jgi:tRNA-2-methylthio-N6-dimethylallyladenosine synthase
MEEARGWPRKGYTEIQLLGQNVNSYRDPSPAGWDFAALLARVAEVPGHPPRALHHLAIRAISCKSIVDAMDANPAICDHVHLPVQSGSTKVLAAMDRLYTRDEYMRRIEWIKNARRRYRHHHRHHRRLPRRDRGGFRADARPARRSAVRFAVQLQVLAAPQHRRARHGRPGPERGEAAAPGDRPGEAARHSDPAQRQLIGGIREVLVEGRNQALGQWIGRTSDNRTLNFTAPDSNGHNLVGKYLRCASPAPARTPWWAKAYLWCNVNGERAPWKSK